MKKDLVKEIVNYEEYSAVHTYIVNCFDEIEIFTRENQKNLIKLWGLEKAEAYFLNAKTLVLNIQ